MFFSSQVVDLDGSSKQPRRNIVDSKVMKNRTHAFESVQNIVLGLHFGVCGFCNEKLAAKKFDTKLNWFDLLSIEIAISVIH